MAALATCLIADSVHAVDIPASARDRVERQCLPIQHREGADAFRQCVTDEITRIGDSSPNRVSSLDLDEQFLVQSACGGLSDAQCVSAQLDLLAAEPQSSLAALSNDERLVLSNSCLLSTSGNGAVAYRQCVNEQVKQLASLPRLALGTLGLLERNALELSCGGDTSDLIGYRQCLLELTGSASGTATTATAGADAASEGINVEDTTRQLAPQDNDSVNAAGVESSDYLDLGTVEISDEGADIASTEAQATEPTAATDTLPSSAGPEPESADSFNVSGLISDAKTRLTSTLQGLDTVGQAVLAAAIVLPLLLVGLWALMRSRNDEEDEEFDYTNQTSDLEYDPDLGLHDNHHDDDEPFNDFEAPARATAHPAQADFSDDDASEDDALPATMIARPLSSGERGAQQPSLEREVDFDLDDNVTRLAPKPELDLTEHKPRTAGFAWQSAFGEWLSKQPPQSRLQSVIELLIYWTAYGDERYDEQMRQTVLNSPDPDAHDLIKRWVLEVDAYALTDAISWMQSYSSRSERCQTLDLLMTLLVTDGAMTPVQNTLLRFLADAFGLGEAELDLQYSRAFGEPMPALPRVDKPTWWAQQDQVRMDRWDARGLLLRPDEEQFRIRLGLSLSGGLDHQDINDAYRRAARRCQPERFDALGQRELALVKRQLGKLEEAREGLLGVNA